MTTVDNRIVHTEQEKHCHYCSNPLFNAGNGVFICESQTCPSFDNIQTFGQSTSTDKPSDKPTCSQCKETYLHLGNGIFMCNTHSCRCYNRIFTVVKNSTRCDRCSHFREWIVLGQTECCNNSQCVMNNKIVYSQVKHSI